MRTPQKPGTKGSLKWIQVLIDQFPAILDNEICKQYGLSPNSIEWLSPLKSDEFAEYKDGAFLELLGLSAYKDDLRNFWPDRGPQWDALGRFSDKGPYILLEAKANISEVQSKCSASSEVSKELIKKSLGRTQDFLNCSSENDWMKDYYQYANRLAHLYFLKEQCGIDARMVFLYFVNDETHIPTSQAKWNEAIDDQKMVMGLNEHNLQRYIAEVFVDIKDLSS